MEWIENILSARRDGPFLLQRKTASLKKARTCNDTREFFPAVEINSSFYRPHRSATYAKWAGDVPADFRFSVKMPKTITHQKRFENIEAELKAFCDEIAGLENKLGCVLVQLPPSFKFSSTSAGQFFDLLRELVTADIACEPRNASWFTAEAEELLSSFKIARVAADPSLLAEGRHSAGARSHCYYRLHGSPRMYYSNYSDETIRQLSQEMAHLRGVKRVWCFYDNTASGAAASNALILLAAVQRRT